jgi:3'(2'), 5'-bisphosphate nucleotidase
MTRPDPLMRRLAEALPLCLEAVWRAGTAVLEVYRTDFAVQSKADLSPVTEADHRSQAILLERLRGLPGLRLPALSEEESPVAYRRRRRWRRFWLVDPLDGTQEFVNRNGEFAINLALVEDRVPVLGIVYAPLADLLYFGARGRGSFRVERFGGSLAAAAGAERLAAIRGRIAGAGRLEPSASPPPGSKIRVIGSRSHSGPPFHEYVQNLKATYREVEVTVMGGPLKMCRVAEGQADLYPRFGPTMEWDTAAPHAVLLGAGKTIRLVGTGEELRYNKEDLTNGSFIAG